ncbi:cytochrome c3 family protein [Crateriforma conspicua]|uniref:cytochrome c3 family protein n=1 Tax=Crateriforma conspicua TaxID=2527996 RepID=UPI00118CEBCA|nr:cytochrome c3 family protein [Crateriforma conspicua]QDV62535.1 Doubled CXXCH motif (Paired_CXXCH_1) [Crateriforma conspicua]
MLRPTNLIFAATSILVVFMIAVVVSKRAGQDGLAPVAEDIRSGTRQELRPAADTGSSKASTTSATTRTHPVIIRQPDGPPRVKLTGFDPQGRSGEVACSTCHSVRQPNLENKTPETLDEFHQGLVVNHGKLACYACHNPEDSDSLKLADGTKVAYQDVMTMCSQCHGPQATAFAHGAHGGMNGHWDLTRGPQMKNNCVDCHDPHSPAYPKMMVGFKPKDRFNAPRADHHDHEGAESHDDH